MTRNLKKYTALAIALFAAANAFASEGRWVYAGFGKPIEGEEQDAKLCSALLKRLNSFNWPTKESEDCNWSVIATLPGFKEPPWETLTITEYKTLFATMSKYGQEGADAYFGRLPRTNETPFSIYMNRAESFIAEGWKLQIWKTPLLTVRMEDGTYSSPTQTILNRRLDYSKDRANSSCESFPFVGWSGYLSVVTPDLKGPDPTVPSGAQGVLGRSSLLLFENTPYFVSSYSVWRSSAAASVAQACAFEFKRKRTRSK